MKKFLSILLLFSFLFLFVSCNVLNNENPMQEEKISAIRDVDPSSLQKSETQSRFETGDAVKEVLLEYLPPEIGPKEREEWDKNNMKFILNPFCNSLCIGYFKFFTSDEPDEIGVSYWGYFDLKDGVFHKLSKLDSLYSTGIDSAIMHENELYIIYNNSSIPRETSCVLMRISAKNDTVEKILDIKTDYSFVDLIKLDEDNLLYDVYTSRHDGKEVTATVCKYNVVTGKETKLFSETYADRPEANINQEGMQFHQICASDGKIYAYFTFTENEEKHAILRVYDKNGKMLDEIDADSTLSFMGKDEVVQMQVCKNYIFIRPFGVAYHGGSIYKIEDKKLLPILEDSFEKWPKDFRLFPPNDAQQVYSTKKCGYFVYYPSGGDSFYVFNPKTEKVTRFIVRGSEKYPDMGSLRIDENGNLRIGSKSSRYPSGYTYFLDREEIIKNLA